VGVPDVERYGVMFDDRQAEAAYYRAKKHKRIADLWTMAIALGLVVALMLGAWIVKCA
jgi:hypothetical protein